MFVELTFVIMSGWTICPTMGTMKFGRGNNMTKTDVNFIVQSYHRVRKQEISE
jgi:hypothetical protein